MSYGLTENMFRALFLTQKDFSRFSESFSDIMYSRWGDIQCFQMLHQEQHSENVPRFYDAVSVAGKPLPP